MHGASRSSKKSIINPLLEDIQVKLRDAYMIAVKVGKMLYQEKGIEVPDDELAFMALHIERLKESIK